jgi:hypothetical protein
MKTFFGGILLAIGILIAGASGLCTITFAISALGTSANSNNEFGGAGMLPLVAIVGGIPFLIGVGLIIAGRALIRADRDE